MVKATGGFFAQWFRIASMTGALGVCLLSGCDQKTTSKSLFEPNMAKEAAAKIAAKLKPPVRVLSMEITSSSMVVQAQDPAKPGHVDSYTYVIPPGVVGELGANWVTGPEPVELNLINPRLEENLFNLDELDLSKVTETCGAAVEKAALEDPGSVSRIRIQRRLYLLPTAHSGDVEWNLEIGSGRESAQGYADAKGRIQRMNLSQTRRAQTLDIMAGGAPVADAMAEIRDAFGTGATLKKVSFSRGQISIVARKTGEPPASVQPYYWDLNGLAHSLGPLISIPGKEDRDEDFFAVDDVDWSKLAPLIALAAEKTGIQGGRITGVYVERPDGPFAKRPVEWRITVEQARNAPFAMNRDEGEAYFGTKGELIRVVLPKSRRVARDFLAVETVRDVLSSLRGNFGSEANYMELSFDDRTCGILAPGPKSPEQIQRFQYDQDHFSGIFGMNETAFYKGFAKDWMFSLDDLEKTLLPTIAEKQKDTLARLSMPEGKITRVTFHRHSPFYPKNKKLLVEIRATGKAGDGYVVYDEKGAVMDVITP